MIDWWINNIVTSLTLNNFRDVMRWRSLLSPWLWMYPKSNPYILLAVYRFWLILLCFHLVDTENSRRIFEGARDTILQLVLKEYSILWGWPIRGCQAAILFCERVLGNRLLHLHKHSQWWWPFWGPVRRPQRHRWWITMHMVRESPGTHVRSECVSWACADMYLNQSVVASCYLGVALAIGAGVEFAAQPTAVPVTIVMTVRTDCDRPRLYTGLGPYHLNLLDLIFGCHISRLSIWYDWLSAGHVTMKAASRFDLIGCQSVGLHMYIDVWIGGGGGLRLNRHTVTTTMWRRPWWRLGTEAQKLAE
jgi:hypothetical protein